MGKRKKRRTHPISELASVLSDLTMPVEAEARSVVLFEVVPDCAATTWAATTKIARAKRRRVRAV